MEVWIYILPRWGPDFRRVSYNAQCDGISLLLSSLIRAHLRPCGLLPSYFSSTASSHWCGRSWELIRTNCVWTYFVVSNTCRVKLQAKFEIWSLNFFEKTVKKTVKWKRNTVLLGTSGSGRGVASRPWDGTGTAPVSAVATPAQKIALVSEPHFASNPKIVRISFW
jgi:hypothetical protein